jgi:uncharacterized protein
VSFTLPPGTFRIDRDGAWRHEGQEVTHPGVLRNLYANLRADAGGHYLQVGPARIPVDVEDAPFVVTRVENPPAAREVLRVQLSDGSEETVDPAGLWLGPSGAPYCRVKSGGFRARFSVPAWLQLAELIEEEPERGTPVLVLGSRRIPLAQGE